MKAVELSGQALDLWMYRYAASKVGETANPQSFEAGYARGEFHFHADPMLVGELISIHGVNLHRIAGEWLAFLDGTGCYGATPGEALCRWVVQHFMARELAAV